MIEKNFNPSYKFKSLRNNCATVVIDKSNKKNSFIRSKNTFQIYKDVRRKLQ